jgi:hypothetical protein
MSLSPFLSRCRFQFVEAFVRCRAEKGLPGVGGRLVLTCAFRATVTGEQAPLPCPEVARQLLSQLRGAAGDADCDASVIQILTVIASEAKQSRAAHETLDCFDGPVIFLMMWRDSLRSWLRSA